MSDRAVVFLPSFAGAGIALPVVFPIPNSRQQQARPMPHAGASFSIPRKGTHMHKFQRFSIFSSVLNQLLLLGAALTITGCARQQPAAPPPVAETPAQPTPTQSAPAQPTPTDVAVAAGQIYKR